MNDASHFEGILVVTTGPGDPRIVSTALTELAWDCSETIVVVTKHMAEAVCVVGGSQMYSKVNVAGV